MSTNSDFLVQISPNMRKGMAMSKVKSSKPIRPQYSNCINYAALSAEEQKLRPPGSSPHSSAVPSKKVKYAVQSTVKLAVPVKLYRLTIL